MGESVCAKLVSVQGLRGFAKSLDRARDHAANAQALPVLERDVGVGGIGGLEFDLSVAFVEVLHGELAVDLGHHHVFVHWREGAVDHQDVAIENARLCHGVPRDSP